MSTTDDLLDGLMKSCAGHDDLVGENGLLRRLSGMTLRQAVQAGMTGHTGDPPQDEKHTDG